jgi:hypothetical protein
LDLIATVQNQIPLPPVEMVMPPINTAVAIANGAILALVALWVAKQARRDRSPIPLLILLGAAVSSLQEPIYDIVGAVWYPDHQSVAYLRAFNVSIPLWLIPGYAWYIGGLGNYMVKVMRDGGGRPLWQYYFVFWLANFALEMPGLNLGIYRYYGDQPFRLFGFPLWMAVTNGLMPLMIGALFNSLRGVLKGPAVLLTVVLVPMVVGTAQIAAGWPIWLALNAGIGVSGTSAAALVSLAFAFCIIYVLSKHYPQVAVARRSVHNSRVTVHVAGEEISRR